MGDPTKNEGGIKIGLKREDNLKMTCHKTYPESNTRLCREEWTNNEAMFLQCKKMVNKEFIPWSVRHEVVMVCGQYMKNCGLGCRERNYSCLKYVSPY